MTKQEALNKFFDTALKGESASYDDHNWYKDGVLKGYIKGSKNYNIPFKGLSKPLTQMTIGQVKALQAMSSHSTYGRLYATGRYQVIPDTLLGVADIKKNPEITDDLIYNVTNQNYIALKIMLSNPNIKPYLLATNQDNVANLEKAALGMAQIWASIGIPYDTTMVYKGIRYYPKKNQSYWPFDKAIIKTETIQKALKELRADYNGASGSSSIQPSTGPSLFFLALLAAGYYVYKKYQKKS